MKAVTAAILFAICIMLITGATGGSSTGGLSKGNCVTVREYSVHAYGSPEFESALVGWFVQDEPLTFQHKDGDWWLVSGHGTDALGRQTRMSGWVRASYMQECK